MRLLFTIIFLFLKTSLLISQDSLDRKLHFFEKAPKVDKLRLGLTTAGLSVGFTAASVGLASAWYSKYDRGRFHTFNDWYEWRQYDKLGHLMSTYFESKWVGDLYQWTGVSHRNSVIIGASAGMLFQTTLEFMDGFSKKWGWSWGDVAFNTLGAGAYLGQELAWKEQRIYFKISTHRPKYSKEPIKAFNSNETSSLDQRAAELYGTSIPELFFKEYNGATIWASVNIASFLNEKPKWLPSWINVAVGYGIENVFGGRRNTWYNENLSVFQAPLDWRRHSQYYLSLDVDFERIKTKSKVLKSVFKVLNVIKVPFPALEFNSLGQFKFKPFYF